MSFEISKWSFPAHAGVAFNAYNRVTSHGFHERTGSISDFGVLGVLAGHVLKL